MPDYIVTRLSRMPRPRFPLIAFLIITVLFIGNHIPSQALSAPPIGIQTKTQSVTITSIGFLPNHIHVQAGEEITLKIINSDQKPHNFVMQELNVLSKNLHPGQSTTVSFTAPQVGSFVYLSNTPGYPEQGYRGTLIIK
ncbi:cupredoxin domain-containing protein [Brevibacillus dissolubilis]|uniref:cupredoxin domain-containing protein n=1 Tax=Brevibacillus dissolubilis TaxID=1844116 RepID=UPI0011165A6E|nr:cupredoxin domain-containing protein [Brevibacillus dissolubilis]